MAPKQGDKQALCIQNGKKTDLRADHDYYLKNLEKLILTSLVTVTDCWFAGHAEKQAVLVIFSPVKSFTALQLLKSG